MSTAQGGATVTIANGATDSNVVDLGEMALVGIQTPAALTSTSLTFKASADNSTFAVVKKVDGTTYSVTVSTSQYIVIPPADLAGIRFLQIIAGSSEGAARTLSLIVRAV